MKFPSMLLPLLAVPLAAVAGYYGGRQQRHRVPPPPGPGSRPGNYGAETARSAAPALKYATAGHVKKLAGRLRDCTVGELPGLFAEIKALWGGADALGGGADSDIRTLSIHREHGTALRLLCARWAELDAPGGLAFFMGREDGANGRSWLLTEWALRDPQAAYEAVLKLPEKDRWQEFSEVGYQLMAEGDEAFLAWFRKARRPLPSGGLQDRFWSSFAAAHPDELLALGTEMIGNRKTAHGEDGPQPGQLDFLYTLLGRALAEKDMDKALAWAKEQPETVRGQALTGVLKVLAATDPERIVDHLSLLKPKQIAGNLFEGGGAVEIVMQAVGTIASRDPLKAVEWLRGNQGKLGNGYYLGAHALGTRFSQAMRGGDLNPRDAFKAIQAVDDPAFRTSVLRTMWQGLPADRLADTAQWLLTVDAQEVRNQAFGEIFPEWVRHDREAAMKFAAGVQDPALAADLYRGFVSGARGDQFTSQGESTAAALYDIPPQFRAGILASRMWMYGSDAMQESAPPFEGTAMARVLEGLPPSVDLDRAVSSVAAAWGTSDAEQAMSWAAGQADPGLREKATGAAMESWAREDAWGASQWLDAQPAGEKRDMAAHHLARALRTEEPESAWSWAGSIADPAIRLEAQAAVLRKWRDSSASDARAAVGGLAADLRPADRQKLVDTVEGRDGAE